EPSLAQLISVTSPHKKKLPLRNNCSDLLTLSAVRRIARRELQTVYSRDDPCGRPVGAVCWGAVVLLHGTVDNHSPMTYHYIGGESSIWREYCFESHSHILSGPQRRHLRNCEPDHPFYTTTGI